MSFEKNFNAGNIIGSTFLAASAVGSLVSALSGAGNQGGRGRLGDDFRGSAASRRDDHLLCLRMVGNHVKHGTKLALRALDEEKDDFDRIAQSTPLGGDTGLAYRRIYKDLYVWGYEGVRAFRDWHRQIQEQVVYGRAWAVLGCDEMQYLEEHWLSPTLGRLKQLEHEFLARHSVIDEELRLLGPTHGEATFLWRAYARTMCSTPVGKLKSVHDTMGQVMYSEIADKQTLRELRQ